MGFVYKIYNYTVVIYKITGIFFFFQGVNSTNPTWLFAGVVLVVLATICNGVASGKVGNSDVPASS